MTSELRERLAKIELAVQSTKPILAPHEYERNRRTMVALGFISQMFEHHEAMLLLLMHEMTGSAFTLGRSVVEGSYRGIWMDACATDAEVNHFIKKDEIKLSMAEIAKAIDATCLPLAPEEPELGQFFQRVKLAAWRGLSSFTHTGMMQLDRRFTDGQLQVKYSDEDVFSLTTLATICLLLLIMNFLSRRGLTESRDEIEKLLLTFGPVEEAGLEAVLKAQTGASG